MSPRAAPARVPMPRAGAHACRAAYLSRPDRNCDSRSLFGWTSTSCGCPSSSIRPWCRKIT
ncbi:hypothetical protein DM49_3933 [Burkholderia mallei]|nr:hypothetical protein DM75_3772 [Burkholderia mallei]KOS76225.1 hypothetical protein DM46_2289 [Burkholderia mallei]KOS94215.1 hypothetical protein DM45_3756 [Burkholderia mallei]KOS95272.1 hypothetical protein DM49_3933 [Burkholderia mallei]KOT02158.1 hypothetical protein DM50_3856 [Burkholderia mallei]